MGRCNIKVNVVVATSGNVAGGFGLHFLSLCACVSYLSLYVCLYIRSSIILFCKDASVGSYRKNRLTSMSLDGLTCCICEF